MDGPYYFEVFLIDGAYNIHFINDRYNEKEIIFIKKVACNDFLSSLTKGANLLIRNLPPEAKNLEDVVNFKKNFKLLQSYIKSLRS
ncbi:hypothetical protein Z042_04900 [Chania multitudinisentens RB-25]|uniref:Uncharacterized protein n=1 Tax=Chania multitudinisentens RB-25 TaxID=1441930 RepID=W0LKZ1_9GAMM|nr:hypothetical protein [Chania multitudinisentens]AHG22665.1 hypothetical protein Z042_04900 [Chania multitudinisentens RB-25]